MIGLLLMLAASLLMGAIVLLVYATLFLLTIMNLVAYDDIFSPAEIWIKTYRFWILMAAFIAGAVTGVILMIFLLIREEPAGWLFLLSVASDVFLAVIMRKRADKDSGLLEDAVQAQKNENAWWRGVSNLGVPEDNKENRPLLGPRKK